MSRSGAILKIVPQARFIGWADATIIQRRLGLLHGRGFFIRYSPRKAKAWVWVKALGFRPVLVSVDWTTRSTIGATLEDFQ
jgi:hypothetical protein